jgi:NDP-mannose synthase
MKDLLAKAEPVDVEPYEGYWLDIGRPDDYMRAVEEFEQRKAQFLPPDT